MSTAQLNVTPITGRRPVPAVRSEQPVPPSRSTRLHDAVADHSELAAVALIKATTYGSVLAGTALVVRALRRR